MEENRRKKIIIWGAGKLFDIVFKSIDKNECKIVAVIDSIKKKMIDFETQSINEIKTIDFDYLIVSARYNDDILKECEKYNIPREKVIPFWNEFEEKGYASYNQSFINTIYRENYLLKEENSKLMRRLANAPFEYGNNDKPIIKDALECLEILITEGKSLCRLGDGEFEIIFNRDRAWFQHKSDILSEKLYKVLCSDKDKVLVAIADNYGSLEKYTERAADGIRKYMIESRDDHLSLIPKSHIYYDTYVSRPYLIYKDKSYSQKIFDKWKTLFFKKHILIIEGELSRFGIGSDLIDSCVCIKRILCPSKNAFDVYSDIYNMSKKYIVDNRDRIDLVLVTLGPTATCLAYDLSDLGIQVIDVGQLDNEYCWYRMGADYQATIPGKLVAESGIRTALDTDSLNQDYYDEIVMKIGI